MLGSSQHYRRRLRRQGSYFEMCTACNFNQLWDEIEDMLDDERFEFAAETLAGIEEQVAKAEHATDRQREAVENIRASRERRER